ncbi:hypothetical protein IW262DRAFT_1294109 [Armillaria fumosa]|nr:hypothetical protein IW262DRAFT_1294109 [Armillaria fumosa]
MSRSDCLGGQFLGYSFDSPEIAQLLQPEIQDLIDSVHPFLAAHEQFYPQDEEHFSMHFLATVISLANNLGLTFQSEHWFSWKCLTAVLRCLSLILIPDETAAPALGLLSSKCPRLWLTPSRSFKQGLNWFYFQMLALAEDLSKAENQYPQLLDFSLMAYWSQAEISSLIGLVHSFLLMFPSSIRPLMLNIFHTTPILHSICFLLTITAVANNLGPYFINSRWACWMIWDELGRLFAMHDQLLGDELLSLPEYDAVPDCLVEPIVVGEFVACGLNAM